MSGGPSSGASALGDGTYFFSVLVPGFQNGGFIDGSMGNLSDTVAGGTVNDFGIGDAYTNRIFTMLNHNISSYSGTHVTGFGPNGRPIIGLAPFDNTSNPGGVYILAVCKIINPIAFPPTPTTSPSDCKYDAFKVKEGLPPPPPPEEQFISGMKYYDLNVNGQWDAGEPGIGSWIINYDATSLLTDIGGLFSVSLPVGIHTFAEVPAAAPWIQTGNIVDQSSSLLGTSIVSLINKAYTIDLASGDTVSGINFGNVCIGANGGGLTLGFWSNKNGQALFGADDLALMVALNLRNAVGSNFDPANYSAFRSWLLSANAVNMAYMLSAQLAAMELNVNNGKVLGTALIYAPGTVSANPAGFATINAIMAEANAELGLHGLTLSGSPYRAYQEILKNALDQANNNLNFLQTDPSLCPFPIFQ